MPASRTPTRGPRRSRIVALVLACVVAVAALVVWAVSGSSDDTTHSESATAGGSAAAGSHTTAADASVPNDVAGVPSRALATLRLIDGGRWPAAANAPGTRGGTEFRNNEGRLPRARDGVRVTYREWDVNPKKAGRGRDAERIVTGSDGSAWYTGDHYRSFTEIRGPDL